jgi:hypothetical protein
MEEVFYASLNQSRVSSYYHLWWNYFYIEQLREFQFNPTALTPEIATQVCTGLEFSMQCPMSPVFQAWDSVQFNPFSFDIRLNESSTICGLVKGENHKMGTTYPPTLRKCQQML